MSKPVDKYGYPVLPEKPNQEAFIAFAEHSGVFYQRCRDIVAEFATMDSADEELISKLLDQCEEVFEDMEQFKVKGLRR